MNKAPLFITEISHTPRHSSIQLNRNQSPCRPNLHVPPKRRNVISYTVLRTQNTKTTHSVHTSDYR